MSEVISPPAPLDRACVLSATALRRSTVGPGALNERPRRAAHAPPSAVLAGRKGPAPSSQPPKAAERRAGEGARGSAAHTAGLGLPIRRGEDALRPIGH